MSIPTVRKMLETLFDVLEGDSDSLVYLDLLIRFISATVFAFRAQYSSLGYKQRKHFV